MASNSETRKNGKRSVAHDEILLSKIIAEDKSIQICFLDGEYMVDRLKWHTSRFLGLKSGKVVNLSAIKYWEVVEKNK